MTRSRLALLLMIAATGCASTTSWNSAVRDANDADEVLIVEFYASWCQPCKWFERSVIPQPDVQAELGRVTFHRIDFDSAAGRHHARRLGVRGVPSFVAVDRQGEVFGGLRGASGASRFIEFLRWAQRNAR